MFTTGISASLLSFFLPHVLIRPLCLCLDLWPRCSESWLCCSSFYLVVRPHLSQPLHPPPPPPLKYIGTLNHDYTKVLQYFFKIKHQIATSRKKKSHMVHQCHVKFSPVTVAWGLNHLNAHHKIKNIDMKCTWRSNASISPPTFFFIPPPFPSRLTELQCIQVP